MVGFGGFVVVWATGSAPFSFGEVGSDCVEEEEEKELEIEDNTCVGGEEADWSDDDDKEAR